jgi:hypothetical protein
MANERLCRRVEWVYSLRWGLEGRGLPYLLPVPVRIA